MGAARLTIVRALLIALSSAVLAACESRPPTELRVAAASDLARAFAEAGAAFERESGVRPVFTFGSSGLLARQIQAGAPLDVFAPADRTFVDQVIASGDCDAGTRTVYGRGRLVVWWPSGSRVSPPSGVAELAATRFSRIAIANPEHAPYGRAAREALTATGAWTAVGPRLVFADNVQQALQFAATGNADVALVALALAVGTGGHWIEVDTSLHAPIDQVMVACSRGGRLDVGRTFVGFIDGESGRAIMRRYGFTRPGEQAATPR
jgi:molybdate transport system substrate-binding protein